MIDFDELESLNDKLVFLGDKPEQYKSAIVGVTHDYNHLIYSYEKFKDCLVSEGMTPEEADDWIGYNTVRSIPYMGEYAPILMFDIET